MCRAIRWCVYGTSHAAALRPPPGPASPWAYGSRIVPRSLRLRAWPGSPHMPLRGIPATRGPRCRAGAAALRTRAKARLRAPGHRPSRVSRGPAGRLRLPPAGVASPPGAHRPRPATHPRNAKPLRHEGRASPKPSKPFLDWLRRSSMWLRSGAGVRPACRLKGKPKGPQPKLALGRLHDCARTVRHAPAAPLTGR
jgi:hypothetical protein